MIASDLISILSLAHKRWPDAGIVKVSKEATRGRVVVGVCR